MASSQPTVVYIAGYGRSGSTLLDVLLGMHADFLGGGELTWLFEEAQKGSSCTCGQSIPECTFWGQVFQDVREKVDSFDMNRSADVTLANERVWGRTSNMEDYQRIWGTTFQAVSSTGSSRYVVDSSKTSRLSSNRIPLLTSIPSIRVKVIHLIRDPRAVAWSIRRGDNIKLEQGLKDTTIRGGAARGILSWIWANVLTENAMAKAKGASQLRLRYEDLVEFPRAALASIGTFLGEDFSFLYEELDRPLQIRGDHGINGNRMRRGGEVCLRPDQEWQERLPIADRCLALLAWPLLARYGRQKHSDSPCNGET